MNKVSNFPFLPFLYRIFLIPSEIIVAVSMGRAFVPLPYRIFSSVETGSPYIAGFAAAVGILFQAVCCLSIFELIELIQRVSASLTYGADMVLFVICITAAAVSCIIFSTGTVFFLFSLEAAAVFSLVRKIKNAIRSGKMDPCLHRSARVAVFVLACVDMFGREARFSIWDYPVLSGIFVLLSILYLVDLVLRRAKKQGWYVQDWFVMGIMGAYALFLSVR